MDFFLFAVLAFWVFVAKWFIFDSSLFSYTFFYPCVLSLQENGLDGVVSFLAAFIVYLFSVILSGLDLIIPVLLFLFGMVMLFFSILGRG